MELKSAFAIIILVVQAAFAQVPEGELRSKINVLYPPLAQQARIQGPVHLKINSGRVMIVSGNPLLTAAAVQGVKSLESIPGQPVVDVTLHFDLIDKPTEVPTPVTVKRGNWFERAILRLFGLNTEKVVVVSLPPGQVPCHEGVPPANDVEASQSTVNVWVYGTPHCSPVEEAARLSVHGAI